MTRRDLNFFNKLHVPPAKTSLIKVLVYVSGIVATAAMIFLVYYFTTQNTMLSKEIEQANLTLKSPEIAKQISEVDAIQGSLMEVDKDQELFTRLEGDFKRVHRVNKAFMTFLQKKLTTNISFEEISITNDSVTIAGLSNQRLSIAKFEEELRKSEKFNHILVNDISLHDQLTLEETNPVYSFNIQITTKDVSFDE